MNLTAAHISVTGLGRFLFLIVSAALVATLVLNPPTGCAGAAKTAAHPRSITITYTTHDGDLRDAVVLLPAWYSPDRNPPLPLVISPHGRGATGESNAKYWGNLPTIGGFAVVCPDGMGRRLKNFSYGYSGRSTTWRGCPSSSSTPCRGSRSIQPHLCAGKQHGRPGDSAARRAPPAPARRRRRDGLGHRLSLRYTQSLELPTKAECVKRCGRLRERVPPVGDAPRGRRDPRQGPRAFAARSPLSQAAAIASSGVPLQIWWSSTDRIVVHQNTQSGALYRKLRSLDSRAPLEAYVGQLAHSTEMRSTALLPLALSRFGLLPSSLADRPADVQHYSVA